MGSGGQGEDETPGRAVEVGHPRVGGQETGTGQLRKWLVLTESERQADNHWVHRCGAVVQGQRVYHSVHDGPFPLSGSGQVVTEEVPYCPQCEAVPMWQGAPIRVARGTVV